MSLPAPEPSSGTVSLDNLRDRLRLTGEYLDAIVEEPDIDVCELVGVLRASQRNQEALLAISQELVTYHARLARNVINLVEHVTELTERMGR
jgi:propanediol dehydratase small subunit